MNTIGRCTHCLPSRFAGLSSRSRLAIERLAIREGVHRHELQRRDGSWRDSVHYSILRSEWPRAKRCLLARLAASSGS
jgi:RimJ/RimL family protein N-acetyltransferase